MPTPDNLAVYAISVAAQLAGIHPQTLRVYEKKGLIDPYRTAGGTRRYSQADIDRLRLIGELTSQGINMAGVKQVLELRQELADQQKRIGKLHSKIEQEEQRHQQELVELRKSHLREIAVYTPSLPVKRRKELRPEV